MVFLQTQAAFNVNDLINQLTEFLPNLLIGLVMLIIGWVIATILAGVVRGVLRRFHVDERVARAMGNEADEAFPPVTGWVGQIVYYLVLLYALGIFFSWLRIDAVSQPLSDLAAKFTGSLSGIVGAAILAVVAWVIATVVQTLVNRVADMSRLDERLSTQVGMEEEQGFSRSLAAGASALVWLAFLPQILDSLGLTALSSQASGLVSNIVNFIPGIFGAAIVLLVGWFIARVLRQIAVNLLTATGVDRLGSRAGIEFSLSRLIGTLVYAFILVPTVVQALDTLGITAVSEPATNMLNRFLEFVPTVVSAGVILVVAYLAARLVGGLVASLLAGVGFDSWPSRLGLHGLSGEGIASPSGTAGNLAQAAVMLFAATAAASQLGLGKLADAIGAVLDLGGQAILALAVFAFGVYLANLARTTILGTMGEEGRTVAMLGRYAILIFAGFMALSQMQLGQEIVTSGFSALVYAIAAAVALAFGLGGRDYAARQLARWMGEGETHPPA
ncbi:hypothetical protein DCC79_07920 [bacterium]|nr:hypothetical protein [Chloroflexi bacterium CFX6]RIL10465.1 MAG: hypothetical protein DCC79_07920 [bacterium]